MKNKWNTRPSDSGENMLCLCTFESDVKTRWVSEGWTGYGDMMKGAVAWMPMTKHVTKDPTDWLSVYRGSELPKQSGRYLVSMICDRNHPALMSTYPKILWYDANKQTFGGLTTENAIAWMTLPKEYSGEKLEV
jgi:hypothetical protein